MSAAVGLLVLLSATPLGSGTGSSTITPTNLAELTSFQWQAIASPQYAGESIDVVIFAKDENGNSYPFNGTALLSTTLGDAYVYPTYVQFSSGVCNTKVIVTIAESLALRCSKDLVSGTSEVFEVLPGAASRLTVVLPGEHLAPGIPGGLTGYPDDDTAGHTFSFQVYRTDKWFNLIDQSDSVTFGSDDRFGLLPAGGRLMNGTGSFAATLRAAGQRHISARLARSLVDYTSSTLNVIPGPYKHMLLVAPGEVLLPGDTAPLKDLPGKEGLPNPQYLRRPFNVTVYACDSFWNPRAGLGDTICLRSDIGDSCRPAVAELNDSVRFSFQFNLRGENRPLWVRDSLTKVESYITYLNVRARGASLEVDALTPDTVRSGETAAVKVRVRDVKGDPIPATLVQFSVVNGVGTIEPALLTDTAGYTTSRFVCTPSPGSEQDSIRITSGDADIVIGIYVKHLSDSLFAFPNPFGSINRDRTLIFYSLHEASSIRLTIYDPFGNEVWARHYNQGEPGGQFGDNTVYWDGTNNKGKRVASGVYLVQVLGTLNTGIGYKSLYRIGVVW